MRLYNDYATYLRERYGTKVYRIGIDAGFTCPNRDGTAGKGGCVFCNAQGARSRYTDHAASVREQIAGRISLLKKAKEASAFVAYFQAFTNTYASPAELKKVYDAVTHFPEVVALSIGTRPDAVDREKLALIASYRDRYDVWIEYGLQSIHDRTLEAINRGHNVAAFLKAYRLTKEAGIKVCAHVILGLPGEDRDDMMATAEKLTALGIDGVKIHLLHVLKGSPLEDAYRKGAIRLLEQSEYVRLAADFLERLSPEIVIQRLTGEGDRENHIAPAWALDKIGTIQAIQDELKQRGSYQGKLL